MATNIESLVYTLEEAGKRLGVSRQRVFKMVQDGKLPGTRLNRKWLLVPAAEVEELVAMRARERAEKATTESNRREGGQRNG